MPLSSTEATYNEIQLVDRHLECDDVYLVSSDLYSLPSWFSPPPPSFDYLSKTFPLDEYIIEIMILEDLPWKDHHHRSSFLPILATVENNIASLVPPEVVDMSQYPNLTHDILFEGNLCNITLTMFIEISEKPGVMENIQLGQSCSLDEIKAYTTLFKELCDVFTWSYEEMIGIDPSIIVYEIKTYPDAKPIFQKLHYMHPRKIVTIKAKVEKLLKYGFVYPIPVTKWVLNIVPVMKKQGTIHICVDYRDLNRACPKNNYLTPFIDQIIDNCASSVIFSFMDGFSGYNQIEFLS